MNLFEDLVIELKEENLLEDIAIDIPGRSDSISPSDTAADDRSEADDLEHVQIPEIPSYTNGNGHSDHSSESIHGEDSPEIDGFAESYDGSDPDPLINVPGPVEPEAADAADLQLMGSGDTVKIRRPASEAEFYKKRANNEVNSLELVDHVISAIEREHLKIVPQTFDSLEAKKALHHFVQVADSVDADAHKEAEFKLMESTEAWCSAIAVRDRHIGVSVLRRYCETCKPMLSSQAMLALARFYRNLPYSENVRGKFDFIITRLFSKQLEDETRRLIFTTDEMLGHIRTLYADWSSIPLYNIAAEDVTRTALTSKSFAELALEAESAGSFDDLIRSDFFNRLRLFKESIAELFFAPQVTAAAIECNVRIGNAYVELIDKERRGSGAEGIHDRFAGLDHEIVSEVTGKSLDLVEILRGLEARPEPAEPPEPILYDQSSDQSGSGHVAVADKAKPKLPMRVPGTVGRGRFAVNFWLLVVSVALITASVGIWFWGNFYVEDEQTSVSAARTFDAERSPFAEHLKIGRISGDTFYGVLKPSWETMPKEKREELLRSVLNAGSEGGWKSVSLMNSQGKSVAFASASKFEITAD